MHIVLLVEQLVVIDRNLRVEFVVGTLSAAAVQEIQPLGIGVDAVERHVGVVPGPIRFLIGALRLIETIAVISLRCLGEARGVKVVGEHRAEFQALHQFLHVPVERGAGIDRGLHLADVTALVHTRIELVARAVLHPAALGQRIAVLIHGTYGKRGTGSRRRHAVQAAQQIGTAGSVEIDLVRNVEAVAPDDSVDFVEIGTDVETEFQVVGDLVVDIRTYAHTLEPETRVVTARRLGQEFENTSLIDIGGIHEILETIRTARNIGVDLPLRTQLRIFVVRVAVGKERGIGTALELLDLPVVVDGSLAVVGGAFVQQGGIIPRVDLHGAAPEDLLEAVVSRDRDSGLADITPARGDVNHTVGAADTEYTRSGSILEDSYVLDLVGVERTEVVTRYAVDQDQRRRVAGGADAAQFHIDLLGTGLARCLRHGQTRQTAGQRRGEVGNRSALQIGIADRSDRTGHGDLFLGTVSDHDHLVDHFAVGFEFYGEISAGT